MFKTGDVVVVLSKDKTVELRLLVVEDQDNSENLVGIVMDSPDGDYEVGHWSSDWSPEAFILEVNIDPILEFVEALNQLEKKL